jgi:hypothetical protein
MKFILCFFIVLAHSCMGQSWLQAWSILAHYDQGVSVLTKNLNNPILKQKASMLDDALLRYRPAKLEWQHMKIAWPCA